MLHIFFYFLTGLAVMRHGLTTQQSSFSISHLLGTVTTLWLDRDCAVTVDNCRHSGDWAANGSVVTAPFTTSPLVPTTEFPGGPVCSVMRRPTDLLIFATIIEFRLENLSEDLLKTLRITGLTGPYILWVRKCKIKSCLGRVTHEVRGKGKHICGMMKQNQSEVRQIQFPFFFDCTSSV